MPKNDKTKFFFFCSFNVSYSPESNRNSVAGEYNLQTKKGQLIYIKIPVRKLVVFRLRKCFCVKVLAKLRGVAVFSVIF